jgi:hypothetical protein
VELTPATAGKGGSAAVWSPARPKISVPVEFAHLDSYEVKVYQELGGGLESCRSLRISA